MSLEEPIEFGLQIVLLVCVFLVPLLQPAEIQGVVHQPGEPLRLAPDGAQQALIDSDPDRFFRPPYVGHRGWVAIVLDTDPDWNMVGALLEQAHGLVKPAPRARRARASLG